MRTLCVGRGKRAADLATLCQTGPRRSADRGRSALPRWMLGLHLQCPGRQTIEPTYCDSQRAIFILPDAAPEVRLVSRAQVPTEARPWLDDQRRTSVRVKRLVLRGADETNEVAMDHPDLTRGWWAVERDGPHMSRWTDGQAVLPLPAMRGYRSAGGPPGRRDDLRVGRRVRGCDRATHSLIEVRPAKRLSLAIALTMACSNS